MENMDLSKLSVAIDLGSSKVKGAIGYVNEAGRFVCITSDTEQSSGICRGYVKNISEAAGRVKNLMTKLKNRLINWAKKEDYLPEGYRLTIDKVYVSISAADTQGVFKTIVRNLPHEEVTEDLIQSMLEENEKAARMAYSNNMDYLMSIPQRYILDGIEEETPVGCVCNQLSVVIQNILVKKDLLYNIKTCFERAGYPNVEFCLSPLSMANVVLTEQERMDGSALIDFGAMDTSVALFKNKTLKYVYILPKGSNHITKDLQELKVPEDKAQTIKHNVCAAPGFKEPCYFTMMVCGEERYFESEVISRIVEDRLNKILSQVEAVISYVMSVQDINQIVLVGGGSKQQFLKEKVESTLGISTRLGSVIDMGDDTRILPFAAVLGVLYNAQGGSVVLKEIEQTVTKPEKKQTAGGKSFAQKVKATVGSFMDDLFKDPGEQDSDKM
ncbi:MAG: hypothetical protein IJJ77_04570 [Paludibacteraceae bacterium]|nr:hypothetical protein [Paludibacteraceae bacterium]